MNDKKIQWTNIYLIFRMILLDLLIPIRWVNLNLHKIDRYVNHHLWIALVCPTLEVFPSSIT